MSDPTIDPATTRSRLERHYRTASYEPAETAEAKKLRRAAAQWSGPVPELERLLEQREKRGEAWWDSVPPALKMTAGGYLASRDAHEQYEKLEQRTRPPTMAQAREQHDQALDDYVETKALEREARIRAEREDATDEDRRRHREADRQLALAESRREDAVAALAKAV